MAKKHVKAFTVIELLLVIAIIGLLSSIVLVATKGIREKAQVASFFQYDATIKHTLGADIVGEWLLDEGSGVTAKDSSGSGNDLTVNPSWAQWESSSAAPELKGAIKAINSNLGVYKTTIPASSPLNLGGGSFTISCWVKTMIYTSGPHRFFIFSITNGSYYLGKDTSNRAILYVGGVGTTADATTLLTEGEWSFVVGTYDQDQNKAAIYINGDKVKEQTLTPTIWQKGTTTGTARIGYAAINNSFDQVRVYSEKLSSAQIYNLYVEGVQTHGLLTEK